MVGYFNLIVLANIFMAQLNSHVFKIHSKRSCSTKSLCINCKQNTLIALLKSVDVLVLSVCQITLLLLKMV